jgi:gamma-glutamylputrescine oxidase
LRLTGCLELAHEEDAELPPAWPDGEQFLSALEIVSGGTVDPGRLLAGLARSAADGGARIVEGARVSALEPAGGGLRLCLANGAVLRANRAVVALNAFAETLLPRADPLQSVLTLAVRTAPLAHALGVGELPFYTVDQPYLWGRPNDDGSWLFGSGIIRPASNDPRDVRIGAREVASSLRRLERRIHGLHPVLAEIEILARWGGPVAFTASRRPIFERHGTLPLLVAGGYAGHGVALACHLGALAAKAVTAL